MFTINEDNMMSIWKKKRNIVHTQQQTKYYDDWIVGDNSMHSKQMTSSEFEKDCEIILETNNNNNSDCENDINDINNNTNKTAHRVCTITPPYIEPMKSFSNTIVTKMKNDIHNNTTTNNETITCFNEKYWINIQRFIYCID